MARPRRGSIAELIEELIDFRGRVAVLMADKQRLQADLQEARDQKRQAELDLDRMQNKRCHVRLDITPCVGELDANLGSNPMRAAVAVNVVDAEQGVRAGDQTP